jgi:signal transduction histidine kinase
VLVAVNSGKHYDRPFVAWIVIAVMAVWTIASSVWYSRPAGRTPLLLTADLAITVAALLCTAAAQQPSAMRQGVPPVTATWVAGPVLAWAIRSGRRAGVLAAVVMSGTDFLLRGERASLAFGGYGYVLMLLAGLSVGYLAGLAQQLDAQRQSMIEAEAATRERERLARDIHDSVLQVLAMVQRRGTEAGGEAAELGRLAGQQETALRALVGTGTRQVSEAGHTDLTVVLAAQGAEGVVVSGPAAPVMLDKKTVAEVTAAVRAALDNVARHCPGARAWVLIEDEPDAVTVTVRDDGPGMTPGRLSEAAAAGRLGVSHSIRGRLRDIGGEARFRSEPGEGTEVELRVPRH